VPEPAAPEPVVVAEPVPVPEPEPEPELDLGSEAEPDGEPVSEVLPAFDESLLEEIGIKVKLIGNVKWFSRKKGFGFVTKADGEELFFHRSDVRIADLRQLHDGTQVEFQIRRTDKGLEAFDVSILPT
jgi:CspA family cold shock protein